MATIFIAPDGVVTGIASDITQRMSLGNKIRVSHIEPVNPVLLWIFHFIRKRVKDDSKLAKFTRQWKCLWRANIFNGPILGPFKCRDQAVSAEIVWVNAFLEGEELG
jgi:hypothetical protein